MKRIGQFVSILASACILAFLLGGCDRFILLDPKGPIGEMERFVILAAFGLMLLVIVPVIIMALWFPWKYRETNTEAVYAPKWSHSKTIEWIVWTIPAVIVTILSILIWQTTHRLDPYKPIETGVAPIRIEAISLDWKWLFIYPDQGIASVNELVFPAGVPLSFRITSASVMTSFFIPQLGSQIYAMGGMQTRLHLLADEPGTYAGQNNQYSGQGYTEMNFAAIATSAEDFAAWTAKVKQAPERLDLPRMDALETPSVADPVHHFSSVAPGLFDHILQKYGMSMEMRPMETKSEAVQPAHGAGHMQMHHGPAEGN
jgi:cytochrome o ubiquinol oxidase subunit 2